MRPKRGPRPSSVVCPLCQAPIGRSCVQDIWTPPRGGNTRPPHKERLALIGRAPENEGGDT